MPPLNAGEPDRDELADLKRILSMAAVGTWRWDLASDAVVWDRGHYRLCGVPEGDGTVSLELFRSIVHEDDRADVFAELARARRDRDEYTAEHRIRRQDDGAIRWVEGRGYYTYENGDAVAAAGIISDVTLRHEARELERRSTARLAMLQRATEQVSAARTPAEIARAVVAEAQATGGLAQCLMYRIAADGSPELLASHGVDAPISGARHEWPLHDVSDGGVMPIGRLALGFDEDRAVDASDLEFLAALARVASTGLARALAHEREAAIRAADAERFRLLFELNPAPMWVFDAQTLAFLAVNEATISEYGWSRDEFLTMTLLDIRPDEDRAQMLADARAGFRSARTHRQSRHRTKLGALRLVDITAHPIPWQGRTARLVVALDETERRALEEQLRQAQKMEAIGQLAGGVAHDFNNLLTVIMGNLEFARSALPPHSSAHVDLEEVSKAASRARVLVGQLLAFGRKQRVHPRDLDLNDVVHQAESMVRRLIGEEITLVTSLSPSIPALRADRNQLEQILLNMAVNARDAMLTPMHGNAGRGGALELITDTIELREGRSDYATLPEGVYARLRVRDTGHGMTTDTLAHLFEPFYTTKPVGSGTGLGLATVFGVMEQCGGAIAVESALGAGSTFTLLFPAYGPSDMKTTGETRVPTPPAQQGVILLVEDEASVRTATRRMLESRGFDVIEASNGREALEMWAGQSVGIRAVVTDVRMPEMGGYELADRLRADRPSVPIVFVSGYTSDRDAPDGPCDEFVPKPFSADMLAVALLECLDASAAERAGDLPATSPARAPRQ